MYHGNYEIMEAARKKMLRYGYDGKVPRRGITLGIRSIMNARRLLLIAKGSEKAAIVSMALKGPVDPAVPASVLQLHPNLQVILDGEAASEIG